MRHIARQIILYIFMKQMYVEGHKKSKFLCYLLVDIKFLFVEDLETFKNDNAFWSLRFSSTFSR